MLAEKIDQIKTLAENLSLLYVDDNLVLCETMGKTLDKLFFDYSISLNGEEGFAAFEKLKPKIVITDINMPKMNGIELARKIKNIAPQTKIIILSSHEENNYLHDAIDLGVFRFLNKPIQIPKLIDALHEAVLMIKSETEHESKHNHLVDIFDYQSNMLIMIKEKKPIMLNQAALDFFDVDDLNGFVEKYPDLNTIFAEQENFLYGNSERSWLEEAIKSSGKIFHTVLRSADDKTHHMLMKLQSVPRQEETCIVSLSDISELNLLTALTANKEGASLRTSSNTISKMMTILHENQSEIALYNVYKGLTISSQAKLVKVERESIVLETTFLQIKAMKLLQRVTLSSELFPVNFIAKSVDFLDLEHLRVTLSRFSAIKRSSGNRKKIRVKPEENHKFTLFSNGFTCMGSSKIIDVCIDALKVNISEIPFGLKIGSEVKISFTLFSQSKPLMVNTAATILRIEEHKNGTVIVFTFDLNEKSYMALKEYIGNRQRILIEEFKALPVTI